ncbi:hypothetical protein PoB_007615000 [Plakobranchus ocellatus]|uniref:Uncharacterized protein n=1 Tax=Plakobranchus ocellatus TaxID=259542 RepID=A0AAV4DZS3_9GAST|nr:hypothetical protein PoB_007615000 [Plakobranchus ocellatus]
MGLKPLPYRQGKPKSFVGKHADPDITHVPPSKDLSIASIIFDYNGDGGGTADSHPALKSVGTPLSRVRTPLLWPDGKPKSLRSPCCRLAIHKNQLNQTWLHHSVVRLASFLRALYHFAINSCTGMLRKKTLRSKPEVHK